MFEIINKGYEIDYRQIPIHKPPKGSKVELEITIRDVETKRVITAIASAMMHDRTLSHPLIIEVPGFPTLPNETGSDKIVTDKVVRNTLELVKRAIEAVISIYNALVNFGVIKPRLTSA